MNPFRPMLLLSALTFGGCVLPIPTTKIEVPAIHGRVMDARTEEPVDLAGVMVKGHKTTAVLTRRDGSFATDQITRSQPFWVWNPFSSDEVRKLKLRIIARGFGKSDHEVEWRSREQTQVHLAQPIRLTKKEKKEQSLEELVQ